MQVWYGVITCYGVYNNEAFTSTSVFVNLIGGILSYGDDSIHQVSKLLDNGCVVNPDIAKVSIEL